MGLDWIYLVKNRTQLCEHGNKPSGSTKIDKFLNS
jgi:hypothetical protein